MKLHGFTGTQTSFTICLDDRDIEVYDIDYDLSEDEIIINSIECEEILNDILTFDKLADLMLTYVDWSAVEQEKLDNYNQMREDEMMEG
jgi:hypothetical protein